VDKTTPVDAGRELKRLRVVRGQTQAEVAEAIGVSRANLAQWESGKYLPSTGNARQLDDHLRASGALAALIEAARRHGGRVSSAGRPTTPEAAGSLSRVFQRVGQALLTYLVRDEHGDPVGWRHNLQKDKHHTPLATAYGMRTMLVVGEPYVDLGALGRSLLAMQSTRGGWQGRAGVSRPETTAAVLDALFRAGTTMPVDTALRLLDETLDDNARAHPYLLATTLQSAARLRPDSSLTRTLIDDLLAARLPLDGTMLWAEKSEQGLTMPEPSVAHTARAVVALREVLLVNDRDDVRSALDDAIGWLVARNRPDDGITEELLRPRPDGEGTTRIAIRHFTSAWVLQALAGAPGVPTSRLYAALNTLWGRYNPAIGLWAWGNGDLPIWMTLDSVAALRSATLALANRPLSPPEWGIT
jgi:DNA-binding XRE family transcriptional regulator